MKRILTPLAACGLAALALAAGANAWIQTNITVEDGGANRFAPRKATERLELSFFAWQWDGLEPTSREHNVRQDRRLFYSGPPTTEDDFGVSASAGIYHYYCENHGSRSGGMDGKIRVRPISPNPPDPADRSFPVQWAIPEKAVPKARRGGPQQPTETGDRYDVRFKVGDGRWRTWKTDTSKAFAQFGHNDHPVHVRNGVEYRFQARTQKGPNDNKVSDWSPNLLIVGGATP